MEEFKPNQENSLEKFKKAEVNLIVKGALSKFKGFGENIASYYDKNQFNGDKYLSILKMIEDYDKKLGNINDKQKKISSGFLEHKNGFIFFGETYPHFTNFPEQNRFYRQTVYSFLDEKDVNVQDAGKIFSALKPFQQYSEELFGQDKFKVEFDEDQSAIPTKLKELIEQTLSSEQDIRLIIKAVVEGDQELLGEKAIQFPAVKTLFSAHDVIDDSLKSNYSLYFGDGKEIPIKAKIWVVLGELSKDLQDYYKKQGSTIIDWNEVAS